MEIKICSRCGAEESTGTFVNWYYFYGEAMAIMLCDRCARIMREKEKNNNIHENPDLLEEHNA